MNNVFCLSVGALCVIATSAGAREFVNLTFDDPDLSHMSLWAPPWDPAHARLHAPVEEAFRGWTISGPIRWDILEGMVGIGEVGGAPIVLAGVGGPRFGPFRVTVKETYIVNAPRPEISLWQVGRVPEEPSVLWYYELPPGNPPNPPGPFIRVSINDVEQPLQPGWGLDCSRFAGQEVELKFTFPAECYYLFDIYGFAPIPEPSTWALAALGGAALWAGRRKAKR